MQHSIKPKYPPIYEYSSKVDCMWCGASRQAAVQVVMSPALDCYSNIATADVIITVNYAFTISLPSLSNK